MTMSPWLPYINISVCGIKQRIVKFEFLLLVACFLDWSYQPEAPNLSQAVAYVVC